MKRFIITFLIMVFLVSACNSQEPPKNAVTIWALASKTTHNFKQNHTTCHTKNYNQNGDITLNTVIREGKELFCYSYEYDSEGRILRITNTAGGIIEQTTEHQYAPDRDTIITTYYEDGKETRRSVSSDSNDGLLSELTSYINGIEESREVWKFDESGNCLEYVSYENGEIENSTTYTYDNLGNNISKVYLKGSEESRYDYSYDCDNRLTETRYRTGTNEELITFIYDSNGNLLERAYYKNGTITQKHSFTYDNVGNMLTSSYDTIRDTETTNTTDCYEYDENSNQVAWHYYSNGTKVKSSYYSYDKNGNLIQQEKLGPDGVVTGKTVYQYDANGNLIKEETFENGSPKETTEKTWVELVVTEEKAKSLYINYGSSGDYRFGDAFVRQMEEQGIFLTMP